MTSSDELSELVRKIRHISNDHALTASWLRPVGGGGGGGLVVALKRLL